MSAPKGNRNREVHGYRAWLAVGRLPKGGAYIRRLLTTLRDQLETAVATADEEISLYKAALIQSVVRHEGRALLVGRWLRLQPDLPLSERLALIREVGNATDSRDKCLKLLGLDTAKPVDPIAAAIAAADRDALIGPATAAAIAATEGK